MGVGGHIDEDEDVEESEEKDHRLVDGGGERAGRARLADGGTCDGSSKERRLVYPGQYSPSALT